MDRKWYHVCWPRLTAKRVEPVVSISWASCSVRLSNCTQAHETVEFLHWETPDISPSQKCGLLTVQIFIWLAIRYGLQFSNVYNNEDPDYEVCQCLMSHVYSTRAACYWCSYWWMVFKTYSMFSCKRKTFSSTHCTADCYFCHILLAFAYW